MRRAKIGGVAFFMLGAMGGAAPAPAQATFGVDLDLFSTYVWRGVTYTNKPVAQPALWVSFPTGGAEVTVGAWSNIDLGRYDGADDLSESGGTSAFNLSEFDPYAEVSFPVGRATLTAGVPLTSIRMRTPGSRRTSIQSRYTARWASTRY